MSERVYKASKLFEKPTGDVTQSKLAIMGRYILTPKIFDILETTQIGRGGEIQLTDAISELNHSENVYAYDFWDKV